MSKNKPVDGNSLGAQPCTHIGNVATPAAPDAESLRNSFRFIGLSFKDYIFSMCEKKGLPSRGYATMHFKPTAVRVYSAF
tara:strand:- start:4592 stop:4831 length:240 start_codon:yes stop_codon:yes gene_type:complete